MTAGWKGRPEGFPGRSSPEGLGGCSGICLFSCFSSRLSSWHLQHRRQTMAHTTGGRHQLPARTLAFLGGVCEAVLVLKLLPAPRGWLWVWAVGF